MYNQTGRKQCSFLPVFAFKILTKTEVGILSYPK